MACYVPHCLLCKQQQQNTQGGIRIACQLGSAELCVAAATAATAAEAAVANKSNDGTSYSTNCSAARMLMCKDTSNAAYTRSLLRLQELAGICRNSSCMFTMNNLHMQVLAELYSHSSCFSALMPARCKQQMQGCLSTLPTPYETHPSMPTCSLCT
jgi:hypothetical protein